MNKTKIGNIILWVSIIISLFTYLGWRPINDYYGIHIFYIGILIFIFLISIYIWKISLKNELPAFILFALSLNNLIDYLFYNTKTLQENELVGFIIIIIFSVKIKLKNKGKNGEI